MASAEKAQIGDSSNPHAVREQLSSLHLFESGSLSLYDEGGYVNLTAGAPGPDLLAKCCDIFDVATRHRMVSEKIIYYTV